MTIAAITQQRLIHQGIAQARFIQPAEVVAWLVAMQGQDYAGAKWSVGLRLAGGSDSAIEQALADRSIVRTWVMRGTLHLVAAADIGWLLALLAPRLIARNARRYRELELDAPTLARSNTLLAQALEGGVLLDRPALFAMLERNGISTAGQRGVYMLQRASLDGLICQGPAPRNVPTFMLIDGALPHGRVLEHEQALAELAQRYVTSRGPATLRDFAWWSGLPIGEARAGLEAAQLTQTDIDGQTYWTAQEYTPSGAASGVYLLPGFDEYLLGYADRSAALAAEHAPYIVPGGNGIFYPTIISAGRVVGTWKRAFKKGSVVITPSPFAPLDSAQHQGVAAAAERFGAFLGLPAICGDETLLVTSPDM